MNEVLANARASGAPQLADFRQRCAPLTHRDLGPAEALYAWSVECYRDFWRTFLEWADLSWEGSTEVVCTSDDVETAVFFPDVRLNYAENLLRPLPEVDDTAPALSAVHGDGSTETLSRAELRARVQATATALARRGIGVGDRVVVIAPNNARAVIAVLAGAALGATVSTAMPDMGPTALLGRFEPVDPAVLVVDRIRSSEWAGQPGDTLSTLAAGLPTLRRVLVLDDGDLPLLGALPVERVDVTAGPPEGEPAGWPRLPFNHPLFVMFTSGTTGPPKAMVHGAGGTLLEHVKEHRLHIDTGPADVVYFPSTTAWMVWNRQLSALAVGAHIVVHDGPVRGPETLWQLLADHRVTLFGTSPAYLQLCQDDGYRPADSADLSRLRAVLSTGSVLHEWQYDWFADAVGALPLQSIGGGTDIIGAFLLGHPELEVQRGRCQTRSLGMDVVAVDDEGREVVGEVGELVCRKPFPSRPVTFLRDPDGRRFHNAYFVEHPGMWTHGDLIEIAADGSARFHGRSDGVLNIDGVRIGPTEIYRVLRGVPEVSDAMAVEQRDPVVAGRSRLVLLVVLTGGVELDDDLARRIRIALRRQASAAHVPSVVLAVPDLPLTHNGKPSERAARDVLNGVPVGNLSALKNPRSLDRVAEAMAAATRATAVAEARPFEGVDEIAAVVGRLWRESVGAVPDDDRRPFTDLGGTSRQAMTLVRQVRVMLGRDVSLETFLADPTLSGLVAAARTAERAADAPPVVQLAPGEPGLPPLFFVHDAWGDIDVYWPVAQLLTHTGPLYGVRSALHRPDGTRRAISELAAVHAAEVQQTAPSGPVRLAGHSFGGLVAYETARLLTAAGREVDFLALIDVLPPGAMMSPLERAGHELADRASLLLPSMRNVSLREMLAERFRPESVDPDRQLFVQSSRVVNDHRPGRYGGPVTYFRVRRRVPVLHHALRAWRRVAPRLTVLDVPGAHHDVLGQSHVAEVARIWSQVLANAPAASRR